jgi:hypothetical protein
VSSLDFERAHLSRRQTRRLRAALARRAFDRWVRYEINDSISAICPAGDHLDKP